MRPLSLPNFDPVEVVRSTVASLSVTAEHSIHEINICRLQDFFSRTKLPSQALTHALEDISALGEVEHLGKGYWLPAPTRAVSLNGDTSLLVSIAPTTELQRHFPSVRRAGLGRLVATTQVSRLLTQSLKSWCGTSELDTATWIRTQIQSATNDFKPSIAPVELEAFSVKVSSRALNSLCREPAWLSISDCRISAWNGVILFRSRLGPNRYRYFLGKQTSSNTFLEGPAVTDPLSWQYGLAALLGKPLTVYTSSQAGSVSIRLPLTAPSSVRRLLSALCVVDSKTFGYVWLCHQVECWPSVKSALQDLGCEIASHE